MGEVVFEYDPNKSEGNLAKHGMGNYMKAEDLDKKFDEGEDILEYFDVASLKRPGLEPQVIEISFPQWMLLALDREAQQLGIQREAVIKLWLSERLKAHTAAVRNG